MKSTWSRTITALTCALVTTAAAALIAQADPNPGDAEIIDHDAQRLPSTDGDTDENHPVLDGLEVDQGEAGAACNDVGVHRSDDQSRRDARYYTDLSAGCLPAGQVCRVGSNQCCGACLPIGVGGLGRCS